MEFPPANFFDVLEELINLIFRIFLGFQHFIEYSIFNFGFKVVVYFFLKFLGLITVDELISIMKVKFIMKF